MNLLPPGPGNTLTRSNSSRRGAPDRVPARSEGNATGGNKKTAAHPKANGGFNFISLQRRQPWGQQRSSGVSRWANSTSLELRHYAQPEHQQGVIDPAEAAASVADEHEVRSDLQISALGGEAIEQLERGLGV